jgi:uncharacterized caspase-like protein
MNNVLKNMYFDDIKTLTDAGKTEMENAINEFISKLNSTTLGVFYYSGHGTQYAGENFMIPIGAMSKISNNPDHLEKNTVSLSKLRKKMSTSSKLSIIILDACRDEIPLSFAKAGKPESGYAPMLNAEGMLIAYATGSGEVARIGSGRNSPYTEQLLSLIEYKLPLESVLKDVRSKVKQKTSGKQIPWYESSLEGEVILGGKE